MSYELRIVAQLLVTVTDLNPAGLSRHAEEPGKLLYATAPILHLPDQFGVIATERCVARLCGILASDDTVTDLQTHTAHAVLDLERRNSRSPGR